MLLVPFLKENKTSGFTFRGKIMIPLKDKKYFWLHLKKKIILPVPLEVEKIILLLY